MTLSPTQTKILDATAQHEHGLATSPPNLPAGARNVVFRSMLRNGLLAEVAASHEHVGLAWRHNEEGTPMVARVTEAGMHAISADLTEGHEPARAPYSPLARPMQAEREPSRARCCSGCPVRALCHPAGGCCDGTRRLGCLGHRSADFVTAVERLRPLLAAKRAREAGTPHAPRQGTKQAAVLAVLRRPEGTGGPQLQEATGWAPHTARGLLAGLSRRGIGVTVLRRVRQAGPDRAGAKGSYSVYHVTDAS